MALERGSVFCSIGRTICEISDRLIGQNERDSSGPVPGGVLELAGGIFSAGVANAAAGVFSSGTAGLAEVDDVGLGEPSHP
jgi:hypothetical protein